jgi:hypothetical protein
MSQRRKACDIALHALPQHGREVILTHFAY